VGLGHGDGLGGVIRGGVGVVSRLGRTEGLDLDLGLLLIRLGCCVI